MPYLSISGTDIYYELSGSNRPAIVLVHGGMCDHRDWTVLAGLLAPDHTVLTLDLRCHGKSGGEPAQCNAERWAEDVNAIIGALKLAPSVIVGHSMGSRVAAEAISQRPERAAALVLLDGSRAYANDDQSVTPKNPPAPTVSPGDVINAAIGPYANEAIRAQVLATMSSASPEAMLACVRAMTQWDTHRSDAVFSGLPHALPVLAIQSTYHDRATPRYSLKSENETTPYLDFLRRTVPQLETKVLTGTGHFSMMERPDDVAALIRAFATRSTQ